MAAPAEAVDGQPQKFSSEKHARTILKALNDNRKKQQFCDGIVMIGDRKIHIQKGVLAAASHYFRLVFDYDDPNEEVNSYTNTADLTSLDIDVGTFETILDYIYTSEITLSEENIQDMLQAADLLLMVELKSLCCEYLENCISSHNCLGILEFAARFNCPWVHFRSSSFLDENFREVCRSEEYLRLPVDLVQKVLTRDTLMVRSEQDILDSILHWVNFDILNRKSHVQVLIRNCLRAKQLQDHNISDIVQSYPSLADLNFMEIILQAKQTTEELPCRGLTNLLIISGGEGKENQSEREMMVKSEVKCFCPSQKPGHGHWIDLAPMSKRRFGHGMVEAGGSLYVIGGKDENGEILNCGEKYDAKENKWTPITSMDHARVGFGLVAIDDNIYALGGCNEMTNPMTSVEVYNIFTNKWQPLPDMNLKRVWSTYTSVDKKIYVIAGGAVGKLFEAVECFDTRTGTWMSVSPMRERRCDARAISVDSNIYVFGGFRRIECPSAMHGGHNYKFCGTEIYSTTNDYWVQVHPRHTSLCTMTDSSQIFGVVRNENEIWVVGDLDVGGTFHAVRACNIHTNIWRCVTQSGPCHQRGFQCCMFQMPTDSLRKIKWDPNKIA